MIEYGTIHDCERDERSAGIVYQYMNNGWVLTVEEYGDQEPINYCPYCGVKLSGEEQT